MRFDCRAFSGKGVCFGPGLSKLIFGDRKHYAELWLYSLFRKDRKAMLA